MGNNHAQQMNQINFFMRIHANYICMNSYIVLQTHCVADKNCINYYISILTIRRLLKNKGEIEIHLFVICFFFLQKNSEIDVFRRIKLSTFAIQNLYMPFVRITLPYLQFPFFAKTTEMRWIEMFISTFIFQLPYVNRFPTYSFDVQLLEANHKFCSII